LENLCQRTFSHWVLVSRWDNVYLTAMSDAQQNRATLSRNFVAGQSCLSDIASFPTFVESSN